MLDERKEAVAALS